LCIPVKELEVPVSQQFGRGSLISVAELQNRGIHSSRNFNNNNRTTSKIGCTFFDQFRTRLTWYELRLAPVSVSSMMNIQVAIMINMLQSATSSAAASSSSSPLKDLDIAKNIIAFVGCNQYRFVAAISKDFQAAYQQLYPNNKRTYYNASTIQHANICIEEGRDVNHSNFSILCTSAARHGSLTALLHVRSLGVPWNASTCRMAAKFGHLHVLKYLHENDCRFDENTCSGAAFNGHLDILQWARKNNYPWRESTCNNAALNGCLNVLQWARANGCPWNERVCSNAAAKGHLEVLQWARKMDVIGLKLPLNEPLGMAIWKYCNGLMETVVHGTLTLVVPPLQMDI
jgi:hypothetical protein